MAGEVILQEIAEGAGVMLDNGETYIIAYSDMELTNTISTLELKERISKYLADYDEECSINVLVGEENRTNLNEPEGITMVKVENNSGLYCPCCGLMPNQHSSFDCPFEYHNNGREHGWRPDNIEDMFDDEDWQE